MNTPRHSALVRITHWLTTISFAGLLVSGVAILLAYPRLHWGETGAVGAPSLIDLPLPFVFGPSGWGRSLHFLSAWVSVLTGALYVSRGVWTRHFTIHFVLTYNVVQRLAYTGVVFVLFPLMIWTGLAMSPAITSVIPAAVTLLGGQQSARTIHFVVALVLVLFLAGHVLMVFLAGFTSTMRAMILGRPRAAGPWGPASAGP